MVFNNRILVAINPEKDQQVALDKAIRIAERLGSSITALVRKKHAVPKLLATLDQKLAVASAKNISVSVTISHEKGWLRALLRAQHEEAFGLVIKEFHAASVAEQVFIPDDWKLLRNNRHPVLLVHADNNWDDSQLLLCVDGNPSDREHARLNALIIETGRFIAQAEAGQINIVSAYPSVMYSGTERDQSPKKLEAAYRQYCQNLMQDEPIPDSCIHIHPGPPELLIPELTKELGVKLVVLGTVARSGLQGVLLGNTAEQVLQRLSSDVLVLPPE